MEALAAIALAGNVLQFLETGLKVLRCGREILASDNGAPKITQSLKTSEEWLSKLAERLRFEAKQFSPSEANTEEPYNDLQRAVDDCITFLNEVKPVLEDLKISPGAKGFRVWIKSVNVVRKRETIKALADDLEAHKSRLALCISDIVR